MKKSFPLKRKTEVTFIILALASFINLLIWLTSVTPTGDNNTVLYYFRPLSLYLDGEDLSQLISDGHGLLYPKYLILFLVNCFELLGLAPVLADKIHLIHLILVSPLFFTPFLLYPRKPSFLILFIYLPFTQILLRSISTHSYSIIYGLCALALAISYERKQRKSLILLVLLLSFASCLAKPTGYLVCLQTLIGLLFVRSLSSLTSSIVISIGALAALASSDAISVINYLRSSASHETITISGPLLIVLISPLIGVAAGYFLAKDHRQSSTGIRLSFTTITPVFIWLSYREIVHNQEPFMTVITLCLVGLLFGFELTQRDEDSIYYRISSSGLGIGLILFDLYLGRTFFVFMFPIVVIFIPLFDIIRNSRVALIPLTLAFLLFANQIWENKNQKIYGNNHWVRYLTGSNFHDPFSWAKCRLPQARLDSIEKLSQLNFSKGINFLIYGSRHFHHSIQYDLNYRWVKNQVNFLSVSRIDLSEFETLGVPKFDLMNVEMWFQKNLIKLVLVENETQTMSSEENIVKPSSESDIDLDLLEKNLVLKFLSDNNVNSQFVEFEHSVPHLKIYVHRSVIK